MSQKNLIILSFILMCSCKTVHKKTSESSSEITKFSQSNETRALYNNLKLSSKKGIMFGHQDDLAYGIGWVGGEFNSDVHKVCGDYPAIFGWDIGHIGSTHNLDSVPFSDMKNWIIEVYNRGGINTISWHQLNPATGKSSWDTSRTVDAILPGGNLNDRFNQQLDTVAGFFNSLVSNDGIKVPVIFRPYHEHNGNWFWWGASACNEDEYKALFRYTVDYLKEKKGIQNVLFCYSTDAFSDQDDYLKRYPGDKYVDIFGFDDYKSIRSTETREIFMNRLRTVSDLAKERGKVAVFSETGYESVSLSGWWTDILLKGIKEAHADIAYVMVWRNANKIHHYGPYPGHASTGSFMKFKEDSATFFLNDLPEMYN
jgi:mannan endo-1,4-beta-mannosidase